jgi:hypothetical protein
LLNSLKGLANNSYVSATSSNIVSAVDVAPTTLAFSCPCQPRPEAIWTVGMKL